MSDLLSWSSILAASLCLCQLYVLVFVRAASAFAERALSFPSLSRFCPSWLFKFGIRRLQSWLLACSAPLLAGHLIIALTWNIQFSRNSTNPDHHTGFVKELNIWCWFVRRTGKDDSSPFCSAPQSLSYIPTWTFSLVPSSFTPHSWDCWCYPGAGTFLSDSPMPMAHPGDFYAIWFQHVFPSLLSLAPQHSCDTQNDVRVILWKSKRKTRGY